MKFHDLYDWEISYHMISFDKDYYKVELYIQHNEDSIYCPSLFEKTLEYISKNKNKMIAFLDRKAKDFMKMFKTSKIISKEEQEALKELY